MATFIPVTNLPQHFIGTDGKPLVSASLEFFLGGTDTPTDLFSGPDGIPIGTSIVMNSRGFPESGGNTITLYRDQSKALKIVHKNAAGATIYTTPTIPAVASFDTAASAKLDSIEENADVTDPTNVAAAGALMEDGSGSMSGDLAFDDGVFIKWSVTAGIVASITQTQGNGALTAAVNEVSTVTNANDTVTLPAAVTGRQCIVINNGANTLQVFPATDDAINSLAVNASATIIAGNSVIFEAYNATNWKDISSVGGMLLFQKGADVVSATALPVITDGNYFDVTGTNAIVSIDSLGVGSQITLQFDASLTLTHHATNLILPTFNDVVTDAGDHATFVEYASGDWRCINYQRADGEQLARHYGALYFSSAVTTTLAAATPAKAAGTTAAQNGSRHFTISTTNRLTYIGVDTDVFRVSCTVGITKSAGGSTTGSHYLYVNDSPVTGASINRTYANATDEGSVALVAHITLTTNDYIELWLETDTGDDLTVNDGTITISHI